MSTYADKPVRVFRSRSEEIKSRLRRKRSCGRLKAFNSNTDNRAWVDNQHERRRYILELVNSYETTVGNYIPYDELLFAMMHLSGGITDGEDGSYPTSIGEKPGIKKGAKPMAMKELDCQKQELVQLAKCLSKAGGDLKKENSCLKEEICRLKKELDCYKRESKKCAEQRNKLFDDLVKCKPPKSWSNQNLFRELTNATGVNVDELCKKCPGGPGPEEKINGLLCEIDGLQKCLDRAECDAVKMIHIIEQQQDCIASLRQVIAELENKSGGKPSSRPTSKNSSQDKLAKCKDISPNSFEKTNRILAPTCSEVGNCKKEQLENSRSPQTNPMLNDFSPTLHSSKGNRNAVEDNYGNDNKEMQCKMQQLQNKVSQQASVIVSQRKCLLEQHKYILEQEQLRTQIQNKLKDQCRKQTELLYERNLLRNEIVFLTARLKTYLGKIQILEKSVEQFFDNTKGIDFKSNTMVCCPSNICPQSNSSNRCSKNSPNEGSVLEMQQKRSPFLASAIEEFSSTCPCAAGKGSNRKSRTGKHGMNNTNLNNTLSDFSPQAASSEICCGNLNDVPDESPLYSMPNMNMSLSNDNEDSCNKDSQMTCPYSSFEQDDSKFSMNVGDNCSNPICRSETNTQQNTCDTNPPLK